MRIALLVALVLLLAAAGCGTDNGSPGEDRSPGDTPTTTQEDEGYNYP